MKFLYRVLEDEKTYGPIPTSISFIVSLFLITIQIQFEKIIDVAFGNRTRGRRIVGADGSAELWRPKKHFHLTGKGLKHIKNGNRTESKTVDTLSLYLYLLPT